MALPGRPHVLLLAALGAGGLCTGTAPDDDIDVEQRELRPARGEILDRHGIALAENRATLDLYLRPHLYDGAVRARLIEQLELDAAQVAELDRRTAGAGGAGGRAILLFEDVGRRRAARIEAAGEALAGAVEIHLESHRHYPFGDLTAHLVGLVAPGVRLGVERSLDPWLRGTPGVERFAFDEDGDRLPADAVEAVLGGPSVEPPVAGHDVVLTIDVELQRVAARAIRDHRAAAVVIAEVDTGRILALVSRPSFDPNAVIRSGSGALARLEADPTRPLDDRTVAPYAPGSTFKLVTAIAGLDSGEVKREDERTCTGSRKVGRRVLYDMEVHGTVDFVEALQVSCNVYFWGVAERVGIERIIKVARELGFGEPSGLGVNGDSAGALPDGATTGLAGLESTLRAAIGNGDVRVTAVQLAMAYAAVVNGGRLFAPQLVERIQTPRGEVVEEPILRRYLAVSPGTLAVIREGMWRVVNARGGTGYAARNGDVPMIGKTGTAMPPRPATARDPADPRDLDATHAWFVALAPAERPELVVVVLVEHGGIGGKVAAPIARAVVDGAFRVRGAQERAARRRR